MPKAPAPRNGANPAPPIVDTGDRGGGGGCWGTNTLHFFGISLDSPSNPYQNPRISPNPLGIPYGLPPQPSLSTFSTQIYTFPWPSHGPTSPKRSRVRQKSPPQPNMLTRSVGGMHPIKYFNSLLPEEEREELVVGQRSALQFARLAKKTKWLPKFGFTMRKTPLLIQDALELKANLHITKVNVPECEITDEHVMILLQNPSVTHLGLNSNKVGDAGAIAISKNERIEQVRLRRNEVGDPGAIALAGSTSIITLHIDDNNTTDVGYMALAGSTSIVDLYIGNGQDRAFNAGPDTVKAFARNTTIRGLAMDTTTAGARHLHEFMGHCSLEWLDVFTTEYTVPFPAGLREHMDKNRTRAKEMHEQRLAVAREVIRVRSRAGEESVNSRLEAFIGTNSRIPSFFGRPGGYF